MTPPVCTMFQMNEKGDRRKPSPFLQMSLTLLALYSILKMSVGYLISPLFLRVRRRAKIDVPITARQPAAKDDGSGTRPTPAR